MDLPAIADIDGKRVVLDKLGNRIADDLGAWIAVDNNGAWMAGYDLGDWIAADKLGAWMAGGDFGAWIAAEIDGNWILDNLGPFEGWYRSRSCGCLFVW